MRKLVEVSSDSQAMTQCAYNVPLLYVAMMSEGHALGYPSAIYPVASAYE